MAFETLRNTADYLRESLRQRKENRRPGQRNYMKNKKTENSADPAYKALIDSASDKKAPFAEKTKGYYRFSREFPDRVDAQGYRINEQKEDKPLTRKGILILTITLVLVFAVGFVLTDTALKISDEEPPATAAPAQDVSVDSNFGEIGTLPQDAFTQEDSTLSALPTEEPVSDMLQESEAWPEPSTYLPEEPATLPMPTIPENTTAFSEAPVEDGQFTTGTDAWN